MLKKFNKFNKFSKFNKFNKFNKFLDKAGYILICSVFLLNLGAMQQPVVRSQSALQNPKQSSTQNINKPIDVNVTINGDPKSRMGFAWFTTYINSGSKTSKLQILEGVGKTARDFASVASKVGAVISLKEFSETKKLLSNVNYTSTSVKKSFERHKALATGLKANTQYSYRVGNDTNGWSDICTFSTATTTSTATSATTATITATADKSAFSFIYVADTQASTSSQFNVSANTLINASKKVTNAKFTLVTGDLIDSRSGLEWEMKQWFSTMNSVWGKMPIVPVMGNHDNNNLDNFSNHFNTAALPTGMKVAKPGTVYSFEYGDALFMILNTEVYTSSTEMNAMANWMTKVSNASTKKWKIAAFHRGLYTGSSGYQTDSVSKSIRKKFAPLFDKLHIDLVLQGHSHVYEVIGPVNAGKLVSGAVSNVKSDSKIHPNGNGKKGGTFDVSGGTLYFLNNTAGIKFYSPRSKSQIVSSASLTGVTNYYSLFTGKLDQPSRQTFTSVNVSSSAITLNTYLVNSSTGSLVSNTPWDSIKIVKNKKK